MNLAAASGEDLAISIHAPLAGRDHALDGDATMLLIFQSTRPLRGATAVTVPAVIPVVISIHAPLAGRDAAPIRLVVVVTSISIHAPLAGRDVANTITIFVAILFQSTRPLRGATCRACWLKWLSKISIHAPLAGRDSKLDEFLSANLRKSNKRDLLSEEKMRHGLPRTTCMSHFRSFFGCEAEAVFCPLALRT